MSDIAQLQATYDTLETELRQAQAQQATTPAGTAEWWQLQRSIAAMTQQKNAAEFELLQAQNDAGLFGRQERDNRLHFLAQELKPPQAVPKRTMAAHHHPSTAYGFYRNRG